MKLRRLFIAVFMIFAVASAAAQVVNPVRWAYKVEALPDAEARIRITATVEPGWHLYSQYNTQGITQQTVFDYEKSANYALVGKTTEPKYAELTDEFGTDRFFEKSPVVFTQKIKVKSEKDFIVRVTVDAQACMEGKCVMVGEDFEIPVKGVPQAAQENVSEADGTAADSAASATEVTEEAGEQEPVFVAETENKTENGEKKAISLWAVFFIALGAGLVTLLTPCVFPLIPMTINFFMHGNDGDRNKGMHPRTSGSWWTDSTRYPQSSQRIHAWKRKNTRNSSSVTVQTLG